METWKQKLTKAFRRVGLHVVRYAPQTHPDARRFQLMRHYGVGLVIDVGAHAGGFAQGLREAGYGERIVSYEPVAETFARLKQAAGKDALWEVKHLALGTEAGTREINVSGTTASSSLLDMLPKHEAVAEKSKYQRQEEIRINELDREFGEIRRGAEVVWLKMDTQGFEKEVLQGGKESLREIGFVQMEVSFVPLYAGAPEVLEMIQFMLDQGFDIVGVDAGWTDPKSGEMLQADITFKNKILAVRE